MQIEYNKKSSILIIFIYNWFKTKQMSYQVSFISQFLDHWVKEIIIPQIPWKDRRYWQSDSSFGRTVWGTRKTLKLYWIPQKEPRGASRNWHFKTKKITGVSQGLKHQAEKRTWAIQKRSSFLFISVVKS